MKTTLKTIRLVLACLALVASMPSVLHAQAAGAGGLERTLTGNKWDVTMELGQRAWGDIRFRDGHEFSTMNGPNGAWKLTGERTVELGSLYVLEFAPGLEGFVVTTKKGGAKVATGKKTGAAGTASRPAAPTPSVALATSKPLDPSFTPLLDSAHEKQWKLFGPNSVTLQNGIINTGSPQNTGWSMLWYLGKKFGDFVLRFDMKLSGQCNSGVYIRLDNPGQDTNRVNGDGYQIDFSSERGIGSVCVHRKCKKEADVIVTEKLAEWNEIEISVVGSRIRVRFNGKQINECEISAEPVGYIGIEHFSSVSGVQFRNMRIQEVQPQVAAQSPVNAAPSSASPASAPSSPSVQTIKDPLGLGPDVAIPARGVAPLAIPPAPASPPSSPTQALKPISPPPTSDPAAKKLIPFPRGISGKWEWNNEEDYVQAGGTKVRKPGSWEEIRFHMSLNPNDYNPIEHYVNAWNGKRIVWEGKWEVVEDKIIKITGGKVLIIVNFDEDMTNFKVSNYRATTGRKLGHAYVEPIVGDWTWGHGVNHVREDGTANGSGVWKRLANDRYEFSWSGGKWIDKATLSQDGKKLHVTDKKGNKATSERVKK